MMDYVFDGLFDWMVQPQIGKKLKNIDQSIQQVNSTHNVLESRKNESLCLCQSIQTKTQRILS